MYTIYSFAFLILTASSTPLLRQKRFDFDCNGIPDECYITGSTAYCIENNVWTSFPATSTKVCTSTTSSTTLPTALPTEWSAIANFQTTTSDTSPSSSTSSTQSNSTPQATLPAPSQFAVDKGTQWTVELQGTLSFTEAMQGKNLTGDKARTGQIGDTIIWNFGDMQCSGGWEICGFSMGPAFYGTTSVMTVNTNNVTLVQHNNFVQPWEFDDPPQLPQTEWGMDTSNVVAVNDTHGLAFAWESWRGAWDSSTVNRGNAVASITLGDTKPVAERLGPLLTDATKIQMGLMSALNAGDGYIYIYSLDGPSNLVVGRVPAANDSAFDADNYSFLQWNTNDTWVPGIPDSGPHTNIGATTASPSGQFGCATYGSVFYNSYVDKYILLCNIYESFVNMFTSDTPWGPFSAEYNIISSGSDGLLPGVYGSMAHPAYGNGKEWYFSIGPNENFQVFKVTFDY